MKANDGRKLSHEALEALRTRAVQAVLDGSSPEVVVKSLGFTRGCIYKWLAAYNVGGFDALKAKKLMGRPQVLLPSQVKWLFRVVKKDPRQLYFDFALWTAKMLCRALLQKFGVTVSKATMCRILHRLGLTPQKPLRRAMQQNRSAVEKWLETDFPAIQAEAKNAGAAIYFGDEAGVSSECQNGTTWSLKGKTPVVPATANRFKVSMISAVSARGDMRFMVIDGTIRSPQFCQFLQRVLVQAKTPIFLVVDNLRTHKTRKVQEFVASTKGKLKLFFLPPYSPELNPDELVWNDLKQKLGRMAPENKDELRQTVRSFMKEIQTNHKKVALYFQERNVKYAA